jgi:hypothetical protein
MLTSIWFSFSQLGQASHFDIRQADRHSFSLNNYFAGLTSLTLQTPHRWSRKNDIASFSFHWVGNRRRIINNY